MTGGDSDASGDEAPADTSSHTVQESTPRRREIVTRGAKLALSSSNTAPTRYIISIFSCPISTMF